MNAVPAYEVFAIKYARHERRASANFIGGDPHDGPMPIDYFVWLIRGAGREIVVDSGFNASTANKRDRQLIRCPVEALRQFGCDAKAVRDLVVTHLHYDHAGNLDLFPAATLHVQDREMQYATGRCMCHEPMRHAFEVEDVIGMVRSVYAGRVAFHDGDAEIAPGVSVHHIGGHTMGMQAVRVMTARGWVVLASDAAHLYANMEQVRPFPIVHNLADMIEGYAKLRRLAQSPEHVVPGHDPLVMTYYPAVSPEFDGTAVRLDIMPRLR